MSALCCSVGTAGADRAPSLSAAVATNIDSIEQTTGTDRQPPEMDEVVAGRYRLERLLARGGMGEVFVALDQSSGPRIALKRMLRREGQQRSPVVNFMREYHALSELRHPRIIEVYDYGVDQNRPYYTMELLDGADLHELSPIPIARLVATCAMWLRRWRSCTRGVCCTET